MKIIRRLSITMFWSLLIYLFVTLLSSGSVVDVSMEEYLLINRGGIILSNELRVDVVMILKIALPGIVYFYMISKFLVDDFRISMAYVFTRNASISKWYFKKMLELYTTGFIFTLVGVLVTCFLGVIGGNPIVSYVSFLKLSFEICILHSFVLFIYALIINILSFVMNPVIGCNVSYLIFLVSILLPMLFKGIIRNVAVFGFPTSQYMLNLYQGNNILPELIYINGFNVYYSLLYLIIVSLIIGISGLVMVKKQDFISIVW